MKKGYKNACESHPAIASLASDAKALAELLLEQVEKLPETRLTRTELIRDIGFSRSGLRVIEGLGYLAAESDRGGRRTYNLREAMLIRILFQGFATAPQTRTVRKSERIQTVARQVVQRATSGHILTSASHS